jgi:hypothetical protein
MDLKKEKVEQRKEVKPKVRDGEGMGIGGEISWYNPRK